MIDINGKYISWWYLSNLSWLYIILFPPTGKQEDVDTILEALKVMAEPFRSMATTIVDICAYAGTGNVLKVQQLLHICSEHYDAKESVIALVLVLQYIL